MNIRTILATGIVLALAAGIMVYKLYNKPHRNVAAETAAYSLTADELYDEFEGGEEAANYKYLDKVIEVHGTIEDISTNAEDAVVYSLSAANAMVGGVSATLVSTSGEGKLSVGESVRLKCRCTGYLMDVVLVDCSILN